MLYLTRKVGESIVINNNVTVTVTEVKGRAVKLGFSFPSDASVLRKEVYDKISSENASAFSIDVNILQDDELFGEADGL
jgi:carbon storage regulator